MKLILHIAAAEEWERANAEGIYNPASLASDGFIHCSSAAQILGVANSFYRGQDDLVLLCIDRKRVEARVRYEPPVFPGAHEPSPTDTIDLYPHIYGPLNLDAIVMVVDFPPNPDGTFSLPQTVEAIT